MKNYLFKIQNSKFKINAMKKPPIQTLLGNQINELKSKYEIT